MPIIVGVTRVCKLQYSLAELSDNLWYEYEIKFISKRSTLVHMLADRKSLSAFIYKGCRINEK